MGSPLSITEIKTPLGPVSAAADEDGLYLLCFSDHAGLAEDVKRLEKSYDRDIRPGASP